MSLPITLRPIEATDRELLCSIYSSTRLEELSVTDWSDEQKTAFLRMQFDAQHTYYQECYAGAAFDVIVFDGEPAGRLYVDRDRSRFPREIRLVDIALLPAFRGKGIGSELLRRLIEEATADQRALSIHVEWNNPALRLYERLGFRRIEDKGIYLLMEWTPESVVAGSRGPIR